METISRPILLNGDIGSAEYIRYWPWGFRRRGGRFAVLSTCILCAWECVVNTYRSFFLNFNFKTISTAKVPVLPPAKRRSKTPLVFYWPEVVLSSEALR